VEFLTNSNVKLPQHERKAPLHKRKAPLLTTFWRWFCMAPQAVAILEWKKWGGHCGAKEKSVGATKISILHGDFSLFWRLSCY